MKSRFPAEPVLNVGTLLFTALALMAAACAPVTPSGSGSLEILAASKSRTACEPYLDRGLTFCDVTIAVEVGYDVSGAPDGDVICEDVHTEAFASESVEIGSGELFLETTLFDANTVLFEGDYVLAHCQLFVDGELAAEDSIGAGELDWSEGGE